jgi:hypothetical protein
MNRKIFIAVLVFAVLMSINFALEIDPDCIVGYGTDELKVIANSGTCENTFTAKCDEVDAAPPTCCKKPGACDISGVDCVDVVGGNGIRGTFDCSSFDNMEKACESAPGDSCVWNPTPTPGGCTGSGCKKLGDACIPLDNDCLTPLECVDGFCSQPGGTCTILPRIYSATLGSEGTSIGNTPDKKVEELTTGSGQFTGEMFQTQWFSDWKAAGLVGIMIAVLIIALAAMIGHAFNLPEIKAFAAAELSQAIISVLLVISLVALLVFFDSQSAAVLGAAQLPVSCSTIEPCYMTAAKFYIDTQLNMSKDIASDQLKISFDYQYRASQGYLTQANKWWLLFMGVSIRPNAGDSLVAERAGTMYSNASKLATSLMAQEYFINVVSFGIAPIFLLLGIVLRTFFFTRKLGGLLLAIAVSLFFVYPLTYAFAWYTLNTTVYGERTVSVSDPACPAECTTPHPAAFFINKNG